MIRISEFTLNHEGELQILLFGVRTQDAAKILSSLANLGTLTEEDFLEETIFEIDGEKYKIVNIENGEIPISRKEEEMPSQLDDVKYRYAVSNWTDYPEAEKKMELFLRLTPSERFERIRQILATGPKSKKEVVEAITEQKFTGRYSHLVYGIEQTFQQRRDKLEIVSRITQGERGTRAAVWGLKDAAAPKAEHPQHDEDNSTPHYKTSQSQKRNEDGLNFNALCNLIRKYLDKEAPEDRLITYEILELSGVAENITDLWVQLADNASPLRKRINEALGCSLKLYEIINKENERYFVLEAG